jgi:ribosomal protein S6|tara:strand:+ start:650 stop:940 length:291 start_codon:yes stop_codon:yes gene_type:complete
MNKRNYLATIVYDAHGADGASDEMIPRLSEIIRDVEGEVTKVENQGSHDFAYPQSKEVKAGTYLQFEISGDTEMPVRLKDKLRLEKKVDRVLIERK